MDASDMCAFKNAASCEKSLQDRHETLENAAGIAELPLNLKTYKRKILLQL